MIKNYLQSRYNINVNNNFTRVLIEQIIKENQGKKHSLLQGNFSYFIDEIEINDIPLRKSFDYVTEDKNIARIKNEDRIYCVLLKNNGEYYSIDGHHRLKWAINNKINTINCIVLQPI